ncbi:MAG: cyclic dehypoxanthinyl futalosine synthase [Fimbriimonadaceae bacterium]|uniref:Cyclic dehypoxanthine futalosine synthase n=1 Tax=Candidatus Nitrosymbiomonas proteolyticus TaxID=2608984 RepID=A0A809R4D1_9BACT|nr:MAG: de-hypoxanthine futalosine cyclase [Armatimonadetes bacterium OLB18]WKZ81228.1 MAG: cyclic dehypoxanthinyl futalosine synthase [Fimbriimonadaceae bacterium]BBO22450.1 de-hypoxanthine futalosine cyclase [Candidatus Nitrosymbiomonas proteolyticus]
MAATGTLDTNTIAAKVQEGDRISAEDALFLFQHASPLELSALATLRREQSAPGRTISYIVGRILNYTNVCWVRCKFCAFYRVPNHPEGYVLSDDDILEKVGHTVATAYELDRHLGVPEGTDRAESVEILFQGGLNPKLKLDYYEGIFRKIKERFPEVILHALSPAEIIYIAHISKVTLENCLVRLKDAGLHSIPGAGGEILVDRVRSLIAPYKDTTEEWLACMRTASKLGIRSTASMMFGHVETLEDRVEHLQRIRDLQDECAPFRAFITWSFQPEDTQLPIPHKASGWDYLRTLAVSRIFLDNIPNVQLSILTQGPKIAQLGLAYGANDFGSIMIEENVVSAAGNKFILSASEFERLIRDAGYAPRRRNTRYELI